jgi:hypothetical protein
MRMRRIILSSVACTTLQFFSHVISYTARYSKKKLLNIEGVFWFSLQFLSETFLILGRTEWDMVISVYWSSCKVSVTMVRFERNINFLDRFSKNIQTSEFMTFLPVGAELFHTNWQTNSNDTDYSRLSPFWEHSIFSTQNLFTCFFRFTKVRYTECFY